MIILRQREIPKLLRDACLGLFILGLLFGPGVSHRALAATPTPLAGLQLETLITIPNWTNTGATQASTDVFSLDPSTHTMYFADRVNKGVSVVDTETNTYLGTIVIPTCNGTGSCPSGVVVAPDLHKLVVTDRNITGTDLNHIFIYDLRLPSAPPVQLTVDPAACMACVGAAFDTDELDYDPLNHRAYVANTKAPFFLTVVDLISNTIVDQIPLPSNPEQPRFNAVDGFIYQTIPDDDTNGGANSGVLRIDATKTGAGAIVKTFTLGPSCLTRGIDVDPLTNTAIVGCAASGGQVLLDLSGNMNLLATFPGVTGTDTEYFNSNLRRWYTASSNNTNSGVSCPQDTTGAFPVIGVFAAPTQKNQIATIVGAECSGRNGHGVGVDPFANQIYTGVRQFPADPASATTGHPGVLVFLDPAPLAQPKLVEESHAALTALPGNQARGKVLFVDSHIARATLANLPSDEPTLLNITTTIGNEVINCDVSGGSATCFGVLKGEALVGGNVFLATSGTPLASGTIGKGNGGFGNQH